MPVDQSDIEITKEVPNLLQKMERGKFYTAEELYKMEYGLEFKEDLPDLEAVMRAWWTSLNSFLVVLAEQGRIVTGVKRGDPPKFMTMRKGGKVVKKVRLAPTVYYGLSL